MRAVAGAFDAKINNGIGSFDNSGFDMINVVRLHWATL